MAAPRCVAVSDSSEFAKTKIAKAKLEKRKAQKNDVMQKLRLAK